MATRGPCKHCAWRTGSKCSSPSAMKVSGKGNLISLNGEMIKKTEKFYDSRAGCWRESVTWDGCFRYTLQKQLIQGVSDFNRRRAT